MKPVSSRLLVSPECFTGRTKFFCGPHVRHPWYRGNTCPRKLQTYAFFLDKEITVELFKKKWLKILNEVFQSADEQGLHADAT